MKRTVFYLSLFALMGITIQVIRVWPDGKLHIFFCDVGQGDGIYIRYPNGLDMLIDGGSPNQQILQCLTKAMPFYDRHIDVVLLTHPQEDHMGGLVDVLQRYSLSYFVIPPISNNSDGYKKLLSVLRQKAIPVKNLYTGAKLAFGASTFSIVWPEREWIASKMKSATCKIQNGICIIDEQGDIFASEVSNVLGVATTEDLNHYSNIAELSYGSFDAVFTGDGDSLTQQMMMAKGYGIFQVGKTR